MDDCVNPMASIVTGRTVNVERSTPSHLRCPTEYGRSLSYSHYHRLSVCVTRRKQSMFTFTSLECLCVLSHLKLHPCMHSVCRSSLPFARECRLGVWFGFVGAALLPAVGACVVLAFGAMPGRWCFLRVTPMHDSSASFKCMLRFP